MCDPVSMATGLGTVVGQIGSPALLGATIALQAGSAIMGYQADKAQYEATKDYNEANALAAQQTYQTDLALIGLRQQQEGDKSAGELFQSRIDAAEAAGSLVASSGNVQGLSVGNVLGDIYAQEGRFETAVRQNEESTQFQLSQHKVQALSRANSRINGLTPAVAPSLGGHALNYAGSLGGTLLNYNRYNPKQTGKNPGKGN
jgi:hypothetical protein